MTIHDIVEIIGLVGIVAGFAATWGRVNAVVSTLKEEITLLREYREKMHDKISRVEARLTSIEDRTPAHGTKRVTRKDAE